MSEIVYQMLLVLRQKIFTTKSKTLNGLLYSSYSFMSDHVTIYNHYYEKQRSKQKIVLPY